MTAKEILALGIRLLGIWLVVEGLSSLIQTLSFFISASPEDENILKWVKLFAIANSIMLFAFSFVFLKFPNRIASLFIPQIKADKTQIDWEEKLVERIGFVLLGVYILSWSIPDLISNISYYTYYTSEKYTGINVMGNAEINIGIFVLLVNIGVGLLLIIGSKRAVNIIHKIRYYG